MRNLIISYDLRNQRDYSRIIMAIQRLGHSEKVLESLWYLKTDYSAAYCRDILMQSIDKDDGVAVFDCTDNTWATYNCNTNLIERLWRP
ncbi:hypothetical protein KRX11_10135 [Pasteurellaceae bacterium TAE3-ERU1]|nr:hypothetical protein [Pasteurellaceae bacterium TAE3-ERU1]